VSIRDLTRELYRAQKQVESLKKRLHGQEMSMTEREKTELQLRQAQSERDRLRAMLDGAKAE
jgi:hypothetical protein